MHSLVGEVWNDAEGVLIRISGEGNNIVRFLQSLPEEAPPLAKIEALEVLEIDHASWNYEDFKIACSNTGGSRTGISADAASCPECLTEVLEKAERRYLYPFTNCTHCGPRLSIIEGIPYDRARTTMADFPMCGNCRSEYLDPEDRRFHAQPIACHVCGPQLAVAQERIPADGTFREPVFPRHETPAQAEAYVSNCLAEIRVALRAGAIVAIRGIGGFHLSCDATNNSAVKELRERKHRYAKPFALIARDVDTVSRYCELSDGEIEQLQSAQAPIVLLDRNNKSHGPYAPELSQHVAPGTNLLGFMLPYTPLHHLITRDYPHPLVMTSGNLSDEPQIIDNGEASRKLAGIADLIVYHNREIANRIDDSVMRCMASRPRLLRRARGFAPAPLRLPAGFESSPEILAYGGELKSTFCLLKEGEAILSQHQGDLEDAATLEDFEKNLSLYRDLYQHRPRYLVADKHPEYLSGKLAKQALKNAELSGSPLQLIEVQHHHAHIASCLAENMIPIDSPAVLGIALDGLGFGDDDTIWGGEFLLADYRHYRRLGRFKPVPMIGGVRAILEPWRNTYAHILAAMGWETYETHFGGSELHAFFNTMPLDTIGRMLDRQLNVPPASSCGRLFDAVAAALGLCRESALYEGQGAIALEMLVDREAMKQGMALDGYPFTVRDETEQSGGESSVAMFTLDSGDIWQPLLQDKEDGVADEVIATRFHAGLIKGIADMVARISGGYLFEIVALSGGCLQNRVLLEGLHSRLEADGFNCLSQARVPANDGGVSLGQAVIAAARVIRKQETKIQNPSVELQV
jgi:hydrogenase maturation protein HypF